MGGRIEDRSDDCKGNRSEGEGEEEGREGWEEEEKEEKRKRKRKKRRGELGRKIDLKRRRV